MKLLTERQYRAMKKEQNHQLREMDLQVHRIIIGVVFIVIPVWAVISHLGIKLIAGI